MKASISKIQFPLPEQWLRLLLIALLGKAFLLIFLICVHYGSSWNGALYTLAGDSSSYIEPIESLLSGNGYVPGFRIPGYGAVYLLLRLVFSQPWSMNIMVLIQWLADAWIVVLIANMTWQITRSRAVHFWAFAVTLLSIYVTQRDLTLLTETLTACAITWALYQLTIYSSTGNLRNLVIVGILLTWASFMKPIYFPLIALAGAFLAFSRVPLPKRIVQVGLFAIPFLVAEGAWIARNYSVHGAFRPLQGSGTTLYPEMEQGPKYPVMRLVQAWGKNYVWWDGSAEIRWFNIREEGATSTFVEDQMMPLPDRLFTKYYNEDSLLLIRADVTRWYLSSDSTDRASLVKRIRERCDRYRNSFSSEKPFQYHITARLDLLRIFIINNGTATLFPTPWPQLPVWQQFVKLFYSGLYLGAMLLGVAGAFIALFSPSFNGLLRILPLAFIYSVLSYPFIMRMCENRYLAVAYPMAVFFMIWLFHVLFVKFVRRNARTR